MGRPLVLLLAMVVALAFFLARDPAPVSAGSCGTITTPWAVPPGDDDCDGFPSTAAANGVAPETFMGTLEWVTCPATTTANDEDPDAWPFDFNDDQMAGLGDVLRYIPVFNSEAPGPPYNARFDLNGNGSITLGDVLKFIPVFSQSCTIAPGAPAASTSRYAQTLDPGVLWDQGCAMASTGPLDAIAILDFGMPWRDDTLGNGTILLRADNPFYSTADIEEAARNYLRGYQSCVGSKHVRLVIGTNNCGINNEDCSGPFVDGAHGQAWAQMVNDLNNWITSDPSWAQWMIAVGGSDMELDWNSPLNTRAWADGYNSVGMYSYYDYGDAAGCPPPVGYTCGTPNNPDWTVDDVWHISWELAAARPLPEIYLEKGDSAAQWAAMAQYSASKAANRMGFDGELTQRNVCEDPNHGCKPGAANTPQQGWRQSWILLNARVATAWNIAWSTDITWQQ